MRRSALAAAVMCIGLSLGGVAAAEWTDPVGRVIFDAPRGWAVQRQNTTALTYVIVATGAAECHIVAQPNGLDDRPVDRIREAAAEDTRFDAATWQRVLNGVFQSVFPNNAATVTSTSKDTSGFWPIQRAEVQGGERPVHATMQLRPGVDILTVCMTFDGPDQVNTFDALVRSVRHPNDPTWSAPAEPALAPTP